MTERDFVLDVSATIPWLLEEGRVAAAERAMGWLTDGGSAFVPPLWKYELASALLNAERRGRIEEGEAEALLESLEGVAIYENDEWPAAHSLVAHGRIHGLTAYDAAYLTLAQRLALPLATNDQALRRAAMDSELELLT